MLKVMWHGDELFDSCQKKFSRGYLLFFLATWCFDGLMLTGKKKCDWSLACSFSLRVGLWLWWPFISAKAALKCCCVMSVLWLTFAKVEILSAFLHLMNQGLFAYTLFNCNNSLQTVYFGSGKRTPWLLYSLLPKLLSLLPPPFSGVELEKVWLWCRCGTNIKLLVRPTMTISVVWMYSVGRMVSPRPLLCLEDMPSDLVLNEA